MESLRRLREPVAWAAVIVLTVRVFNAIATAIVYAGREGAAGVPEAAVLISYRAVDPALVAVLTLVLLSCVLGEPTPRVRTLTTVALVVVGVSFLVALAFTVLALTSPADTFLIDAVDLLTNLAVPALALVTLVKLLPVTGPGRQPAGSSPGQLTGAEQPALPPVPDPRYQPTWQPDQAAGAAWQTAGDAAAGAPASGWGTPGQQGGWQYPPSSGQPQGPQPPTGPPPGQQRPDPGLRGPEQSRTDQPPWLGGSQS